MLPIGKRPNWEIDFWKRSTKEKMDEAWADLVANGEDPDVVQRYLENLYYTIAEEFGL